MSEDGPTFVFRTKHPCQRLKQAFEKAGPAGLTREDMIEAVYGLDPDRHPDNVEGAIAVHLSTLKKQGCGIVREIRYRLAGRRDPS